MDALLVSLNALIASTTRTIPTSRVTTTTAADISSISPPPAVPKTGSGRFSLSGSRCNRCYVSEEISERNGGNWVVRVLQLTWPNLSFWNTHGHLNDKEEEEEEEVSMDQESCDACCRVDDEDHKLQEEEEEFDKDSFSKLLSQVCLAEARLYAKMAYLGSLSYTISKIKLGLNLLKRHRLRYVTSSLEKKAKKEKVVPSEVGELITNVNNSETVADDDGLNSLCSSPCEWFICDDDEDEGSIRYFVIQGSESIASWQANILFEPIQFEAHDDVVVHRGIYEAAKVVYEQLLPHVHQHLQLAGDGKLGKQQRGIRLTGHSLGGSLALLVNLMLLIREQVPRSCLLPVITFGAPWVMCGGDRLLQKLGLPTNHLQGITMHRDIVPRAFSCNYPTQLADILKAVNGNFRNHPCLTNHNLLYAPMGEFLILQPDAKVSPSHELLPAGCGLYVLRCSTTTGDHHRINAASDLDINYAKKQKSLVLVAKAQSVFLNTPHPLEILRDQLRCAYGSEGAIQRDHDVDTYLISIRTVIRHQLMLARRRRRELHAAMWWKWNNNSIQSNLLLLLMHTYGTAGRAYCLKWLRVLPAVASNHMHFLLICLVRWLVMEACNWITRT